MLWIDFIPLVGQILLMGAGAVIVRKASRPLNDHPHCKRCGFDLSAHGFEFHRGLLKVVATPGSSQSDKAVCPECGTRLTPYDSVRFGKRRINRPLFALGFAIAVSPMVYFIGTVRVGGPSQFVTRNAPDSLVVRLGEDGRDYRFSAELLRRIKAGELSKAALDGLTARAIAVMKQPARVDDPLRAHERLWGALIDAGAITPTDLAAILGEPRVALHLAPRINRNWAPIVHATADFETPNIPEGVTISVENVVAYMTDVLDPTGRMTRWDVIDGSFRGGTMYGGAGTSSGSRIFSLRIADADARGTFKSDARQRDYDVSADVVIGRNGVELFRRRASTSGQQELIDAGEPLIVLDMDPATNAAARACYEGMWGAFTPANGQPRARLSISWPHSTDGPMRLYRITVRPAGRPDATPLIDALSSDADIQRINGTYHFTLRTRDVVDADFRAVDVHFEPDIAAANRRYDGLRHTSIAGEAFTIREVPVK